MKLICFQIFLVVHIVNNNLLCVPYDYYSTYIVLIT